MNGHVIVAPMILAEVESGVLLRSFVIALVVVAPSGWWQWRKVRASRRAAEAASAALAPEPVPPEHPPLEAMIAELGERARNMAAGESCALEVPATVTIDGAPADASLVDALVRDALRREGLRAVGEVDLDDRRVIHCEKT